MSRSFQIPATVDEAIEEVSVTVQLLTKKGWELAALIYALCEPRVNQYPKAGALPISRHPRLSFNELSRRLGGAKSGDWVATHWHNWQYAIDHYGATDAALGSRVVLPSEEYPAHPQTGTRTYLPHAAPPEQKRDALLSIMADDPEAASLIEDAIVQRPEVVRRMENTFVQRAARDPELHSRIDAAYEEFHPVPIAPPTPRAIVGFGSVVYGRVRDCTPILQDYLASVKQREGRRGLDAEVQEEIDTLERAKGLIEEYEAALRRAIGVDYDETFARLVGRQA